MRLFDRSGAALELTKEGEAVAAEAERVVGSYRRLQSVAALQGGSPASHERFRVVVSPFAKRTLAPVIEEFGRIGDDDRVVDLVEASVYDMARRYDRLDAGTLYVLDLPMDLGIVAGDLPPGFLDAVLNDPGFFEPFLLSSFMLRCADGSAYSKKPWVRWSDLDMDKIACHNDAFLEQMIRHYLGRAGDGEPGMKVTNPDLLDAAVREQGMVSLFGSFPVIFRERNRQPTGGVAVELRPEASFVTGVVGGATTPRPPRSCASCNGCSDSPSPRTCGATTRTASSRRTASRALDASHLRPQDFDGTAARTPCCSTAPGARRLGSLEGTTTRRMEWARKEWSCRGGTCSWGWASARRR